MDLDSNSEMRLNQVLFKDNEEAEIDPEQLLLTAEKDKTPKDSKVAKLRKANKSLK